MTRQEVAKIRSEWIRKFYPYRMIKYKDFNYKILDKIMYIKRAGRGNNDSYNEVLIMADTETSKKKADIIGENHVCAWTISLRAFNQNLVTIYGNKPSELIECITKMHERMEGQKTIIYFHNLSYDYVFLRQFMFKEWGFPVKMLNTKPHYPIIIEFPNGLIFKDSLILAQRSLDRWAKDMQAEHQKAVGKWDYNKIRNQDEEFTAEELEYIEHDTLAGVECLQATMDALNKKIYSVPYTATGIPREEVRIRGADNHAHDVFLRHAFDFQQYIKGTAVYHGGFTHANRFYLNTTITGDIKCYDFNSSYPYCLLSEKMPAGKFRSFHDVSIDFILKHSNKYAFMFKLVLINPRLKNNDVVMPALQLSNCTKVINPITDNGRILCAAYAEIYLNELDLEVIADQYIYDKHLCTEVEFTYKDYIPKWLGKYIFELYEAKTKLKKEGGVLYALAKAKLNSIYGMMCQKAVKEMINENYETGEYYLSEEFDAEEEYNKFLKRYTSVIQYAWGIWTTSAAMRNLHELGKCVDGIWLYSDTDSIYATSFNEEKLNAYNENCKKKLIEAGYGAVIFEGKEYWLGVATLDKECTEFRYQGAKRYCYRSKEDGELHITVAGVPKKAAAQLKTIDDFQPNLIFNGVQSGKKLHTYFYTKMYVDENGNETADSINLSPADYLLSSVDTYDWEKIFEEEIKIQVYEDEEM